MNIIEINFCLPRSRTISGFRNQYKRSSMQKTRVKNKKNCTLSKITHVRVINFDGSPEENSVCDLRLLNVSHVRNING